MKKISSSFLKIFSALILLINASDVFARGCYSNNCGSTFLKVIPYLLLLGVILLVLAFIGDFFNKGKNKVFSGENIGVGFFILLCCLFIFAVAIKMNQQVLVICGVVLGLVTFLVHFKNKKKQTRLNANSSTASALQEIISPLQTSPQQTPSPTSEINRNSTPTKSIQEKLDAFREKRREIEKKPEAFRTHNPLKIICVSCLKEDYPSNYLKSDIGVGWVKCPNCGMQSQKF